MGCGGSTPVPAEEAPVKVLEEPSQPELAAGGKGKPQAETAAPGAEAAATADPAPTTAPAVEVILPSEADLDRFGGTNPRRGGGCVA